MNLKVERLKILADEPSSFSPFMQNSESEAFSKAKVVSISISDITLGTSESFNNSTCGFYKRNMFLCISYQIPGIQLFLSQIYFPKFIK